MYIIYVYANHSLVQSSISGFTEELCTQARIYTTGKNPLGMSPSHFTCGFETDVSMTPTPATEGTLSDVPELEACTSQSQPWQHEGKHL